MLEDTFIPLFYLFRLDSRVLLFRTYRFALFIPARSPYIIIYYIVYLFRLDRRIFNIIYISRLDRRRFHLFDQTIPISLPKPVSTISASNLKYMFRSFRFNSMSRFFVYFPSGYLAQKAINLAIFRPTYRRSSSGNEKTLKNQNIDTNYMTSKMSI